MKIYTALFILLCVNSLNAQNLVPNPGFEDNVNGFVLGWEQPAGEYYHYESKLIAVNGRFQYNSNNGLCLLWPSKSEYLVVKLTQRLQAGKVYCVRTDAMLGEVYVGGTEQLGSVDFAFSNEPVVVNTRTRLYLTPAVSMKIHGIENDKSLDLIPAQYTANGNEQYLIIGKFFTPAADSSEHKAKMTEQDLRDEKYRKSQEIKAYYLSRMPPLAPVYKKSQIKRETEKLNDSIARIEAAQIKALADNEAYYAELTGETTSSDAYHVRIYFDNVCVAPVRDDTCACTDIIEQTFKAGQTYRLNNVYFDLDKAILKKGSYTELDKLLLILNSFPQMEIQINGHTDSLNTEEYNVDLSNRRAKAVYDYLVQKGIKATRLSWKGYGESIPLTENQTEEGRAVNRRVEFLVLKNE